MVCEDVRLDEITKSELYGKKRSNDWVLEPPQMPRVQGDVKDPTEEMTSGQ